MFSVKKIIFDDFFFFFLSYTIVFCFKEYKTIFKNSSQMDQ